MTTAKPFIKWVGGKRRLLPQLRERIPVTMGRYHEPFLGGGALFFDLQSDGLANGAYLSDSNRWLIDTYKAVKFNPKEVLRRLDGHAKAHSKERYYHVRGWNPADMDLFARAARFIYLNKTCFNGLYRVNKKNKFNVPMGRYANPNICDEEAIMAASDALQGVYLSFAHYDVSNMALSGDVVYFDPPYVPVNKTSDFVGYTRDGFTLQDQEHLRDLARDLKRRGVTVILSNSDTQKVRELYADGFDLEVVTIGRSINSKPGQRGKVGELIIT